MDYNEVLKYIRIALDELLLSKNGIYHGFMNNTMGEDPLTFYAKTYNDVVYKLKVADFSLLNRNIIDDKMSWQRYNISVGLEYKICYNSIFYSCDLDLGSITDEEFQSAMENWEFNFSITRPELQDRMNMIKYYTILGYAIKPYVDKLAMPIQILVNRPLISIGECLEELGQELYKRKLWKVLK